MFRGLVGAPAQFNTVLFGGLLGSLFSFLQFIASPIIGGLSDRFGRKPLMIGTCVGKTLHILTDWSLPITRHVLSGISFSYLLWVLSSNFAIFVLARIIGGISKGEL